MKRIMPSAILFALLGALAPAAHAEQVTKSGGTHCCTTTRFFAYSAQTNSYRRTPSLYWGDSGYEVKDLDGDGRLELSGYDGAFAGAFSSYAASGFPPRIVRYASTGKATLTTVTRRFRRSSARTRRGG